MKVENGASVVLYALQINTNTYLITSINGLILSLFTTVTPIKTNTDNYQNSNLENYSSLNHFVYIWLGLILHCDQ